MLVLRSYLVSLAATALSLLFWLSPARATPLALDAELPAALQACVTAPQLEAAYQHALAAYGGEDIRPLALQVSVRGSPGADPDTTLLQLTASTSGQLLGTRELAVQARDCSTLPDALGLVLALLTRNAPAPEADASPPTANVAQEVDVEPPAHAAEVPTPTQTPAHVALGIGGGALFGVLPSAAAALQLQAAIPGDGEPLSLRLKAGLLWPQEQRLAEGIIEARSYELSLEGCAGTALSPLARFSLRVCAGPRFGLMVARGRGFVVQNQGQREFLIYLGVLPEASMRIAGQTWLQLAAGAAIALVRPRFEVGLAQANRLVDIVKLDNPALLRAELTLSVVQIF